DLGVEPDEVYLMTLADVLGQNDGLIAHAAGMLAGQNVRSLSAEIDRSHPPAVVVRARGIGLSRVDLYQGSRPLASAAIDGGAAELVLTAGVQGAGSLELRGFSGDDLAAIARIDLGPAG